jgi:hypothetical protein
MSLVQARLDIANAVQAVKTAWVTYPLVVETDNRNSVDYSTQSNPFLQVDVNFIDGEQLDLSATPRTITYGQIILSAVTKDGAGSLQGLTLLDFAIPYFQMQDFPVVRTKAAEPQRSKLLRGWYYQPVLINFWTVN